MSAILKFLCYIIIYNVTLVIVHEAFREEPEEKLRREIDQKGHIKKHDWMPDISKPEHDFEKNSITSLFQCSRPELQPTRLGEHNKHRKLEAAARKLQKVLILKHWLKKNHWAHLLNVLDEIGVKSLRDLSEFSFNRYADEHPTDPSLLADMKEAQQYLPSSDGIAQLEHLVWTQYQAQNEEKGVHYSAHNHTSNVFVRIVTLVVVIVLSWLAYDIGLTPSDVFWGFPLHKSFTKLDLPEDMTASHSKTLSVSFYNVKGRPLDVTDHLNVFKAEVWHQHQSVNAFVSAGKERNMIDIVFTSRIAGRYFISLKNENNYLRNFPTYAVIDEGEVCASSTILVGARSKTLVVTSGIPETVQISARDAFGNKIPSHKLAKLANQFKITVESTIGRSSSSPINPNFVVYHLADMETLSASLAFFVGHEGWYKASITLNKQPIDSAKLTLIVLSSHERSQVDELLKNPDSIPVFESELVAVDGEFLAKPKNVFCSLTTKQLSVKEYVFKFFPRRLYTFRIVPDTKIRLVRYTGLEEKPVIQLEDSLQGKPHLVLQQGNIMAATFHLMLLKKIGGSESFLDKQAFFNCQLLKHHISRGNKHTRLPIRVNRADLLNSSLRATRWFGESDWMRLFEIEFEGEEGLDQGGVRREWFEILTRQIFHPSSGLFSSVEENSEAVHPNPNQLNKGKLYRFAGKIVGKSLYESAHGVAYRQCLPLRLAKSFLVRMAGLPVNYRHFATDAPELFRTKIQFIEQNPVEDLDLSFTDEVFGQFGDSVKVVELKPGGAKIPVTEANKIEYLDLLAQHRLSTRIKEQMEYFMSGLQLFVPDTLLSLFDELEMELLLCGVREYNLEDLKEHHTVIRGSLSARTIEWFWQVLSNFSPEQFARLLQFTTGSSQLPAGGFAELKPIFQIGSNSSFENLPTAHTCFNMICLPEHRTFKKFERSMLTAINEGNEGFGFA